MPQATGESIIVLSNRAPIRHDRRRDGEIVVTRSTGELVAALEPVVRARSAVWVAHGAGTADRLVVDERDGVDVGRGKRSYRLRYVWLDAEEVRRYHQGFASEGLWPLCHAMGVPARFRAADFDTYRTANARFAGAVCDEAASDSPIVVVPDYHVALAPRMIRRSAANATIIACWHIPWPRPHQFAICPWARPLLEGLLGSTILGFQTPRDRGNFIDTVEYLLDAEIDEGQGSILFDGRQTAVRVYPTSIEWPNHWTRQSPSVQRCRTVVCRELGLREDVLLGVGVDQLDHTKGLEEKFLAVERLLDIHPELRERFVFVQIADPTRDCLRSCRELRSRLWDTVARINDRFRVGGYEPIVFLDRHYDPPDVYRFFRAADVCYVGSLSGGTNLVAKEFVSARDDEHGVLMLSEQAGAARELSSAVIVNPYVIDDVARAFADALSMSDRDQVERMRAMRSVVAQFDADRWADQMLEDAAHWRQGAAVSAEVKDSVRSSCTADAML